MFRATKRSVATMSRIAVLAALIVGPVGAFAVAHANSANGPTGAGLVIYVSLQRAG